MGNPTFYKKGTLVFNNQKAWNGYTMFQVKGIGVHLINMNGEVVKIWKGVYGSPNKIFPNGYLVGSLGERDSKYSVQDMEDLVIVNWNGQVEWKYNKFDFIKDDKEGQFIARQHHDYQIEGSSVGYYYPEMNVNLKKGNKLILGHKEVINSKISDKILLDDVFYEINHNGEVIWSWFANEHFEEFNFSEEAKKSIYDNPNLRYISPSPIGDWLHINSMSILGENKHYPKNEKFNPNNIIFSSREANIIAIIDKNTKKIVWKLGPHFSESTDIGNIIGPHHVHIIPKGLPGEGNILLFDNGGWAGYGAKSENSKDGTKILRRDYSRVLEIDPSTLKIIWQYTPKEAGFELKINGSNFYSPLSSSAQRLENGNTLITEGVTGRIFEVTKNHEIVWEYINPYQRKNTNLNMIYRAYRIPYHWIPQLEIPKEESIENININFEKYLKDTLITEVEGVKSLVSNDINTCVATEDDFSKRKNLFKINGEIFDEITENNYEEIISQNLKKKKLIFIGAERCKNCKQLHNLLEEELKFYKENVDSYHLDGDMNKKILEKYNIRSIPTILIIKNGIIEDKSVGSLSLDELQDFLEKNLEN